MRQIICVYTFAENIYRYFGSGILAIFLSLIAWPMPAQETNPAAPPPLSSPSSTPNAASNKISLPASQNKSRSANKKIPARKSTILLWNQLTPTQQSVLSPLATEWNKMSTTRQQKWLRITERYSVMKPEEQQRLQAQMADWVKLTPDQRRIARENYSKIKTLPSQKKQAQWHTYQQLPDDEKKALTHSSVSNKTRPIAPPTGNLAQPKTTLKPTHPTQPRLKSEAIQQANQPSRNETKAMAPNTYSIPIPSSAPIENK